MAKEMPHPAQGQAVETTAVPAPSRDLFSQLPEDNADEKHRPAVDDSASAMGRLRTPFEVVETAPHD
jgi:hypothetical protein